MHNVQHNPTMMYSIRPALYSPPPMTAITKPGTLRRADTVNITSSMRYDTHGEPDLGILCQLQSTSLDSNVIQWNSHISTI